MVILRLKSATTVNGRTYTLTLEVDPVLHPIGELTRLLDHAVQSGCPVSLLLANGEPFELDASRYVAMAALEHPTPN